MRRINGKKYYRGSENTGSTVKVKVTVALP